MESVKIVECARDAWHALARPLPPAVKSGYVRRAAAAGLRHLDVWSAGNGLGEWPAGVDFTAMVVNDAMLEAALQHPQLTTLAYPYSVSAHYRRATANVTRAQSRQAVERIRQAARDTGRRCEVHIAMAFGNPFEEPWGTELIAETLEWLKDIRAHAAVLVDTEGAATAGHIAQVYREVKDVVAGVELGVHLHTRGAEAAGKVAAAYGAGCRRFDTALAGVGVCPFAHDAAVGNLPTEVAAQTLLTLGAETSLDASSLAAAADFAKQIRSDYA
jgi:hydroxymethylglutaryl-CoA lyase